MIQKDTANVFKEKIEFEKKEKQILNEITRDIVTIIATIISVIAFAFAIWATVVTIKQANRILEAETKLSVRIEKIELQILEKLDQLQRRIG